MGHITGHQMVNGGPKALEPKRSSRAGCPEYDDCPKPDQANPSNLALKVIAMQSGGRVIPPTNDVAAAIGTVVQDAGSYYEMTFEPPRPDGPNEYHELKLKVSQPSLTAHTNAGYYGQPTQVAAP